MGKQGGRPKYTADGVDAVKSLFMAQCSFSQIERVTGIDDQAVRRILEREGFVQKSYAVRPTYSKSIRAEAIRIYVEDEVSARAVGLSLSVPDFTVKAWLKEEGVLRSMSEAATLAISKGQKRGRSSVHIPWHSTKTGQWHMADSTYEAVRMSQLDVSPSVVNWSICKRRIPYTDPGSGKQRRYIPDLEIQYANGTIRVEEIKPSGRIQDPINQAKFSAAREYFRRLGVEFAIVTEAEIGKSELKAFRREGYASLDDSERKARTRQVAEAARARRQSKESDEDRVCRLARDAARARQYRAKKRMV